MAHGLHMGLALQGGMAHAAAPDGAVLLAGPPPLDGAAPEGVLSHGHLGHLPREELVHPPLNQSVAPPTTFYGGNEIVQQAIKGGSRGHTATKTDRQTDRQTSITVCFSYTHTQ